MQRDTIVRSLSNLQGQKTRRDPWDFLTRIIKKYIFLTKNFFETVFFFGKKSRSADKGTLSLQNAFSKPKTFMKVKGTLWPNENRKRGLKNQNLVFFQPILGKIYSDWGTNISLDGTIAPTGPSFDELLTKRYEELQNIFSSVSQIKQVRTPLPSSFSSFLLPEWNRYELSMTIFQLKLFVSKVL